MVPVVKDVDRKGIVELSQELARSRARRATASSAPADMQGGTLHHLLARRHRRHRLHADRQRARGRDPGRGALEDGPVWDGTAFQPRLMQPLYVSYDHRVIDGALAARFTRHLCHVLEDVRRLVL